VERLAAGTLRGALAVSLWAVPLVAVSGGWTLYRRATAALLTDFYGATNSVFGARATWKMVLTNANIALVSSAIAAIPLVAWSRAEAPGAGPCGRPWL